MTRKQKRISKKQKKLMKFYLTNKSVQLMIALVIKVLIHPLVVLVAAASAAVTSVISSAKFLVISLAAVVAVVVKHRTVVQIYATH